MNEDMRKGYSEAMIFNGQDKANKLSEDEQIKHLKEMIKDIRLSPIFKETEDFIDGYKLAIEDIKRWY